MAAAVEHIGSTPHVEEEKEVNKVVVEGREQDDEILRFMDSLDSYLLLMDSLSSTLRQGWFDLASARHSMGLSRISSTLFDHKVQSAATKLQVADSADLVLSESNKYFSLWKWGSQDKYHSENVTNVEDSSRPKLRYRGPGTTSEGSYEPDAATTGSSTGGDTTICHVQEARSKALSVFGGLVSPKLRTAQVSFETALEQIIDLANSRSAMLSSFSQIKRKGKVQPVV